MQTWIDQHTSAAILIAVLWFLTMWIGLASLIARMSGWHLLAIRFRLQGDFLGPKWSFQSAQTRWLTHYNGCLTVGADPSGLFIQPMIPFRFGHPPLFIPWTEITVGTTRVFLMVMTDLRLGRGEQIPFKIRSSLAARLRSAAGQGWPATLTPL